MFGYRAAATDLVEQAALIGRFEASFCDFTSFLSLTDERRTGGRVSVGGDYITEVRVGKGPFNDREVFVFQPITNIDLTRGAQACKMMLLGLPFSPTQREFDNASPDPAGVSPCAQGPGQVHKVYPLSGLKLAGLWRVLWGFLVRFSRFQYISNHLRIRGKRPDRKGLWGVLSSVRQLGGFIWR
jgi:hypothetical protein